MKNIKHRLSKGFTLIELMVVISIISLLSSIVLASVKEVREKSKATKFRAEVNQFITALELYKNDKGVYPGQENPDVNFGYTTSIVNETRTDSVTYPTANFPLYTNYKDVLNQYIKNTPVPPASSAGARYFYYLHSNVPITPYKKCFGDVVTPPYVILVSSSILGFEDWPYGAIGTTLINTYRCFSLK